MINTDKNSIINWQEFLEAMNIVRAKTKNDKLNLFMKLADSDGNGLLNYEEIHYLAKISLKTNFVFSTLDFKEDKFLENLTNYFSKLIFKIC